MHVIRNEVEEQAMASRCTNGNSRIGMEQKMGKLKTKSKPEHLQYRTNETRGLNRSRGKLKEATITKEEVNLLNDRKLEEKLQEPKQTPGNVNKQGAVQCANALRKAATCYVHREAQFSRGSWGGKYLTISLI